MDPSRQEIRTLISNARTEQAIERLLTITENTRWHDEVVQQSAKFREWQKSKRLGTLSTSELDLALNRINLALLEIIAYPLSTEPESRQTGEVGNFPKPLISNSQLVEIILQGSLEDFNSTRRENLIHTIAAILRIEASAVKIKKVVPGSIKVIIELSEEKADELIRIFSQDPQRILNSYHDLLIEDIHIAAQEKQMKKKSRSSSRNRLWQYILAIGVIVGIFGSLAEIRGCFEGRTTKATNTITVLAHGQSGRDELVLPGRGVVQLIYGDAKVSKSTNKEGEATFRQIPENHFAEDAWVELHFTDPEGEPYRAAHPDSLYKLEKGKYVALEVVLEGMDQIEGRVKDFVSGEPLDSVLIRLSGHSYFTNSFGEFSIDIPRERQAQFIDLSFSKPGYERKELTQVPTTTGRPQTVSLKPLQ